MGYCPPNLSLTSFFTFDKYTILSSGEGLNILATFKFVLSEATQYQQKIYCEEYGVFFCKNHSQKLDSAKSMYARNMFKISNTCIFLSFSHFMKWLEQISSHFMKWLEYFSHFMKWLTELAISRNG